MPDAERVVAPTSQTEQIDAISRCLVDARLKASPLPEFPQALPETMQDAYAVQSASIERWPDNLAGWKVARLSPADQQRHGAERLAGPVFESSVQSVAAGASVVAPIFVGGFAAIEPELVIRLAETVPPSARDYSDEELAELVATAYIGTEIASSPMADVNALGPTSTTSDFGCNAGVIVGPEIPEWHSRRPEQMPVTVTVDGECVGQASPENCKDGPLQALRFLLNCCARRGIELAAGTIISTGAITGVHEVAVDSSARVDFGAFGSFGLVFEPRTAIVPGEQA